ncbi:hypothetical protein [Stella sp.]|uniref:hypothetical protein n=1 Tax=Stella sp. TaxID=2912054 RepID=UPI0035AF6B53
MLAACAPAAPFAADDPADPTHRAATPAYRSPFAGQPAFAVAEPRPWRETNDLVRRLGGAAGHLREPPAPDGDGTGGSRQARP